MEDSMATTLTNAPESQGLSRDDIAIFEAARTAVNSLKRTFEMWMTIAVAVERARRIADGRGSRHAFQRLLEQQGIAQALGRTWAGQKSTASKLLKILAFRAEVEQWRTGLTDYEQIAYAAPTTIFKHCPLFGDMREPPKKPSAQREALADADAEMKRSARRADEASEHSQELEEELEAARDRDQMLVNVMQAFINEADSYEQRGWKDYIDLHAPDVAALFSYPKLAEDTDEWLQWNVLDWDAEGRGLTYRIVENAEKTRFWALCYDSAEAEDEDLEDEIAAVIAGTMTIAAVKAIGKAPTPRMARALAEQHYFERLEAETDPAPKRRKRKR
jgi:hypothetical protein